MAGTRQFDEQEAIAIALDVFWRKGLHDATMGDLAAATGVQRASLYNAYGDKRALFARSLERYAERSMRDRIARMEANHQPRQAIVAFIAEIIDRSLKDPDRKGCLMVNSALDVAPHDAEIGKVVGGYLDEIRVFFRRNIEAARKSGQVPGRIDAEEVSGHLLGVLLGIRVLARTGARRKLLEATARPALDLLEGRR